jgi:hypothetical protein
VVVTLSLKVILVGLLWSLELVVGWNLKERRIGLGAGQVLGFSCGWALQKPRRCWNTRLRSVEVAFT